MIVALLAQLALWFGFARLSDSFQYGHHKADRPIEEFVIWWLVASLLMIICARWAVIRRWSVAWILIVAAVFRLIVLPTNPVQEDDFYRYLWDGAVQASGVNPYLFAPGEVKIFENAQMRLLAVNKLHLEEDLGLSPFNRSADDLVEDLNRLVPLLDRVRLDELYYDERWNSERDVDKIRIPVANRVNHRLLPTVYPPLAQGVFQLAARINEGSLVTLRALFLVVDLATCLLIVGILKVLGRPEQQVAWYAWNPLVIKEFINSPHLDVLMVCCAALVLWCWVRNRMVGAAFAAALGATVKLLTGLWLPLLLLWQPRRWKVIVAAGLLIVGIFTLHHEAGSRRWQSMQVMGHGFNMNSAWPGVFKGIYGAFSDQDLDEKYTAFEPWHLYPVTELQRRNRPKLGDRWVRKVLTTGILIWLAFCFWRARNAIDKGQQVDWMGFILAGPLLLSPVQNPWYFGILMIWLALRPRLSLMVLMTVLGLYYARFLFRYVHVKEDADKFFGELVDWQWLCVLAAIVVECVRSNAHASRSDG